MYKPLQVDEKHEMCEAIIARSEYISLQNDDKMYQKLYNLPYKLLCASYNRIVKKLYQPQQP